MGRLQDKVAWVTGGASGMGAATVRRFREEGASVFFTDVQVEKGEAIAGETGAVFHRQDVAEEGDWEQSLDVLIERFGRLDVLMNNAGIVGNQDIEKLDLGTWARVLGINLTGVMLGCRFAIAQMRKNPSGASGSIINIASTSAYAGLPSDPAYTATKGAVRSMTKSIAVDCARKGYAIRCNLIAPGAIETGITLPLADANPAIRKAFEGMSPLGRMGVGSDIAAMATFLASDESGFCTGAEFLVDGGMLAAHPGV